MDGIMDACLARDGSFDFNTPFLSSSASSPTYDSADPFTPRSGRSTPHGSSFDMGDSFSSHGSYSPHGSFTFEPTAPMSIPKGSFHLKHEPMDSFQYPAPMPLTPTRQESQGFPGMELDYNTMLQFTLEQQAMSNMSPSQSGMMGHYPTQPVLQSSPFSMPTPSRSLPNSTPTNSTTSSMWPCNSESPIAMFGPHHTPPSPSPTQLTPTMRRGDDESPTLSPSERSYRRRGPMVEAQRTAMALQRYVNEKMRREQQRDKALYSRYKSTKLEQGPGRAKPRREVDAHHAVLADGEVLVPSPRERCNFAGCRKTYQKKEHLKRHQRAYVVFSVMVFFFPLRNASIS